MKHTVTVLPENRILEAEHGILLYDLLLAHGYYIPAACGGRGVCGKCKVRRISAPSSHLPSGEQKSILSCQTRVTEDLTLEYTPQVFFRTVAQNQEAIVSRQGAVLDLGTTTLALRLYDMDRGVLLGECSALNPQGACGADVLTRIDAYAAGKGGLLQESVLSKVREMLSTLVGEQPIEELTVVGNPTMLHLFLGIDPTSIGVYPFTPSFKDTQRIPGEKLGIKANKVVLLPFSHAYIGSDVTVGALFCNLQKSEKTKLLVDIGTNGELMLSHKQKLFSASCAAGPALEGASIECGTGGIEGAICHVSAENGDLRFETVGSAFPIGICGSGLIDLVALLVKEGMIDESGAWDTECQSFLSSRLLKDRFYLCDGIYLSQADIRQIQLAKSAISAGIKALLHEADVAIEEIQTVYIAGGLGFYMDLKNATEIGLLPCFPKARLCTVGNTALLGAAICLGNAPLVSELEALCKDIQNVELSFSEKFREAYIEDMLF